MKDPCDNCEEPCYYCDFPCKEKIKYLYKQENKNDKTREERR